MPKPRNIITRREVLEVLAASGALSVLGAHAFAASHTPRQAKKCDGTEGEDCHTDADKLSARAIGEFLWVGFAAGAGLKYPDDITKALRKKGEDLSGPPLCKNLNADGIDKFPFGATLKCAIDAGTKARELADGESKPINETHFATAWKKTCDDQNEKFERLSKLKRKGVNKGGAC